MKLNKRSLHQQRKQLDERLRAWRPISLIPRPRHGWLKAVRESLGISSTQLAKILSTDSTGILKMEKREIEQKVTLEMLDRAAKAMGCKLVYALVPDKSLEQIVDQKAHEAASKLLRSVSNSMKLEKQELTAEANSAQLKELTQELKAKLDPILWEKTK